MNKNNRISEVAKACSNVFRTSVNENFRIQFLESLGVTNSTDAENDLTRRLREKQDQLYSVHPHPNTNRTEVVRRDGDFFKEVLTQDTVAGDTSLVNDLGVWRMSQKQSPPVQELTASQSVLQAEHYSCTPGLCTAALAVHQQDSTELENCGEAWTADDDLGVWHTPSESVLQPANISRIPTPTTCTAAKEDIQVEQDSTELENCGEEWTDNDLGVWHTTQSQSVLQPETNRIPPTPSIYTPAMEDNQVEVNAVQDTTWSDDLGVWSSPLSTSRSVLMPEPHSWTPTLCTEAEQVHRTKKHEEIIEVFQDLGNWCN